MPRRILLVDNEQFQAALWIHVLRDESYEVDFAQTVQAAIERLNETGYDLLITDLRMPPAPFTSEETIGGFATGVRLGQHARLSHPGIRVIVYTSGSTSIIKGWLRDDSGIQILEKPGTPDDLLDIVRKQLGQAKRLPRMFIVHGHALDAVNELRSVLRDTFHLGMPVVLVDEPAEGRTIIEKFEQHADKADLVFVLLTPDDAIYSAGGQREELRPRQNVVFELGFFYGRMRRTSGRIVLLATSEVALPSDLRGIGFVDISAGVDAAEAQLRRELQDWL